MEETVKRYRDDLCQKCGEISCTLNFDEALETILDNVEGCLNIQASAIHLIDPSARIMKVAAVRNLSENYARQIPTGLKDSRVNQEIMKGAMVTISDARENPDYRKLAESEGIRSILCTPLKSKEKIIGALWLFTREVRAFTGSEISYITTLSGQGGVVLGNAKMYQSLYSLAEISRAITSHLDLKKVLNMIAERAAKLMAGKGSSVLLVGRQKDTLEVSTTYGLSERFLQKGPIHIAKSIRECLEQLIVIPDVFESKEVQYPEHLEEEKIRSILCAPLKVRERAIGTLRVYLDHQRDFSREDLDLFQILSDFSAIAIENARLFNHIKRDYDDLTRDVWEWYDWGKRSPNI